MFAAPCVWFGLFNAFLLLFQIKESEGTTTTTVTKEPWSQLVEVPSFTDGNSHYFVVVEDNDKNI